MRLFWFASVALVAGFAWSGSRADESPQYCRSSGDCPKILDQPLNWLPPDCDEDDTKEQCHFKFWLANGEREAKASPAPSNGGHGGQGSQDNDGES